MWLIKNSSGLAAALLGVMSLSGVAHANAEGGSSGSGGGGNYTSRQLGWHTVGAPGGVRDKVYAEELATFKKYFKYYNLYALCPKSEPDLLVPEGKQLGAMLDMRVENEDGSISPIKQSEICDSPEHIQSFGRFFMALAEASRVYFVHELFQKAYELGGKIPVVITTHRFQLPSVTGAQPADISTYDPINKQIFFYTPPSKEAMDNSLSTLASIAFERGAVALIRHEVMHVLLHRAMGRAYPIAAELHYGPRPESKDCSVCDDVPAGQMCQCKHIGEPLPRSEWNTDYQSALIEGICDWAEAGQDGLGHPYDARSYLTYASDYDQRVCYYTGSANSNVLNTLLSNEGQINTSLRELTMDRKLVEKRWTGETNPGKRTALLNAIASGQTNLPQLIAEFDRLREGDEGLRWMRKYFAFDYQDTTTLRSLLKFEPKHKRFCLTPEDSVTWFPGLVSGVEF